METKVTSVLNLFNVEPCDVGSISNEHQQKLKLNASQRSSISHLYSQLPSAATAGTLSNAYILDFPEGVTGTLMRYKNGGYGSAIMGEKGIVAHAFFKEVGTEVVMLNAFSAMSIASGQYFLAEINKKFDMISQEIDKIMEFLYEDKKAGLLAEINFAQYAYKNFSSIMLHAEQRIATITGLQSARKVAMKNIEFDLHDIDSTAKTAAKSYSDFEETVNKVFQIRNSLELAMQLYVMGSFMESYFSENYDTDYLAAQQTDILFYISKCEKQMLSTFSRLNGRNEEYKSGLVKKIDTRPLALKIQEIVAPLNRGDESMLCQTIRTMSDIPRKGKKYCVTKDGDAYILD